MKLLQLLFFLLLLLNIFQANADGVIASKNSSKDIPKIWGYQQAADSAILVPQKNGDYLLTLQGIHFKTSKISDRPYRTFTQLEEKEFSSEWNTVREGASNGHLTLLPALPQQQPEIYFFTIKSVQYAENHTLHYLVTPFPGDSPWKIPENISQRKAVLFITKKA